MDVYDCLRTRRTVRRFRQIAVPDTILTKIIDAVRWAPSSRNQQPWHLVVIRNKETLDKMGRIAATGTFIREAPVAIAVVMADADSPGLDAGRALQQMELIAWSEGLGTCFVTLTKDEEERIAELLEIPPGMDLITVMPFGYRLANFSGRGIPRKPLAQIAHSERFGDGYGTG